MGGDPGEQRPGAAALCVRIPLVRDAAKWRRPDRSRRYRCACWWPKTTRRPVYALIDLINLEGIDAVDSVSSGAAVLASPRSRVAGTDALADLLLLDWSLPTATAARFSKAIAARRELAPRHIALTSVPRTVDDGCRNSHPDGLHFCDKPILPGALRRLCDAALGQVPDLTCQGRVPTGAFDGMRVLLAEDNATSRDVAVALLGRWGIEVDTAADGRDALAQLAARAAGPLCPGVHGSADAGHGRLRGRSAISGPGPGLATLPVYALSAHSGRSVLGTLPVAGHERLPDKPYVLPVCWRCCAVIIRLDGAAPLPPLPAADAAVQGLEGIPGLDPPAPSTTPESARRFIRVCWPSFRDQFAAGPQALRRDVEGATGSRSRCLPTPLKGRAACSG